MLALIPLVLLIATICGVFYYVLSKHGLAARNGRTRRAGDASRC